LPRDPYGSTFQGSGQTHFANSTVGPTLLNGRMLVVLFGAFRLGAALQSSSSKHHVFVERTGGKTARHRRPTWRPDLLTRPRLRTRKKALYKFFWFIWGQGKERPGEARPCKGDSRTIISCDSAVTFSQLLSRLSLLPRKIFVQVQCFDLHAHESQTPASSGLADRDARLHWRARNSKRPIIVCLSPRVPNPIRCTGMSWDRAPHSARKLDQSLNLPIKRPPRWIRVQLRRRAQQ